MLATSEKLQSNLAVKSGNEVPYVELERVVYQGRELVLVVGEGGGGAGRLIAPIAKEHVSFHRIYNVCQMVAIERNNDDMMRLVKLAWACNELVHWFIRRL